MDLLSLAVKLLSQERSQEVVRAASQAAREMERFYGPGSVLYEVRSGPFGEELLVYVPEERLRELGRPAKRGFPKELLSASFPEGGAFLFRAEEAPWEGVPLVLRLGFVRGERGGGYWVEVQRGEAWERAAGDPEDGNWYESLKGLPLDPRLLDYWGFPTSQSLADVAVLALSLLPEEVGEGHLELWHLQDFPFPQAEYLVHTPIAKSLARKRLLHLLRDLGEDRGLEVPGSASVTLLAVSGKGKPPRILVGFPELPPPVGVWRRGEPSRARSVGEQLGEKKRRGLL